MKADKFIQAIRNIEAEHPGAEFTVLVPETGEYAQVFVASVAKYEGKLFVFFTGIPNPEALKEWIKTQPAPVKGMNLDAPAPKRYIN